jgi:putrescine transport system ATP-binding protein
MISNNIPALRLEGVTKLYGHMKAVSDVNLSIADGEFFSLLGPVGCGKTSVLQMMAGLEPPTTGRIFASGHDLSTMAPNLHPALMLVPSVGLFSHLTVAGNIGHALKRDKLSKEDSVARVSETLEIVHLAGLEKRRPDQLSAGQRLRLALACCLAKRPKVVLVDDFWAALDKNIRRETQFELVRIHREVGTTFVVATSDQEDALIMSTRIAVMDQGRVLQLGKPRDIYEYPIDRTVAEFIGEANLFDGQVISETDGILRIIADGIDVPLAVPGNRIPGEEPALMLVRPEKIMVGQPDSPEGFNILKGIVDGIAYLGFGSITRVRLESGRIISVSSFNRGHGPSTDLALGQPVTISWSWDAGVLLP